MPNHVHFIMVPADEEGLRATFAQAHRRHTGVIHFPHRWTGHLWQGRLSSAAMDEANLHAAVRASGEVTATLRKKVGQTGEIVSRQLASSNLATTWSYLWCGPRLCQARNAADQPTRGYYGEGEFVPGSLGAGYYYAPDRVGSARRVFSASAAPTYDFDPYGNALQATAPVTDYGYAGMIANADSGLYLTTYRPYDPVSGRFLLRDPIGEAGDPLGNLYAYVGGDSVDGVDPDGLQSITVIVPPPFGSGQPHTFPIPPPLAYALCADGLHPSGETD